MEFISIDPDVFKTAIYEGSQGRHHQFLKGRRGALGEGCQLVVDDRVLRREYGEFMNLALREGAERTAAAQFVEYIMANTSDSGIRRLKGSELRCIEKIETLLAHHQCLDIEKTYVAMATALAEDGLTVYLTSPSQPPRRPCFQTPGVKDKLCDPKAGVTGLRVECVIDALRQERLEVPYGRWFEDKVCLAMMKVPDCPRNWRLRTDSLKEKVGEVDVWFYSDTPVRRIWIGECKFQGRQPQLDNDYAIKGINQLIERQPKILEYERAKGFHDIELRLFLISNVPLSPKIWESLDILRKDGTAISYLQACLTEGGAKRDEWGVTHFREYEPVCEQGTWRGQFVRELVPESS